MRLNRDKSSPHIHIGRTLVVLLAVFVPSGVAAVILRDRFEYEGLNGMFFGLATMTPAGCFLSMLQWKTNRGEWNWFIKSKEPVEDEDQLAFVPDANK